MSNSSVAEAYFIIGMMVLIVIVCIAATYLFFRQYKREHKKTTSVEKHGNSENPDSK